MKKFFAVVLSLCLIFGTSFLLTGCGESDIVLTGGPAYSEPVYGNGGMVVRKGDYVYFASGYIESKDMSSKKITNSKGSVENGGLYRARMTEEAIEEGEEVATIQVLEDVQLMVSKIVGFENSGMYIFKDKIYFASPTIERDSSGVRFDLVTFFYCNLDGSGLKSFYQTTEFGTNANFSMTMIDEEVYLIVYTGSQVIRVKPSGEKEIFANEVTGVVFPSRKNILNNEENPSVNDCFVYYTIDNESENGLDLGNVLYKKDIVSKEETKLYDIDKVKINLISIEAGRLFYTRNNTFAENNFSYYSNSLETENFESSELRHTMNTYSDFVALGEKNGNNLGIAFVFNGSLYIRGIDQGINEATKITDVTDILTAENGYVYYIKSSALYRIDITVSTPISEKISGDLKILDKIIDIDQSFCYFFVTNSDAKTGHSLYRIALDGLADKISKAEKIG